MWRKTGWEDKIMIRRQWLFSYASIGAFSETEDNEDFSWLEKKTTYKLSSVDEHK